MNHRRPRPFNQIINIGMRELRNAELTIQAKQRRPARTLTNLTVPPPPPSTSVAA